MISHGQQRRVKAGERALILHRWPQDQRCIGVMPWEWLIFARPSAGRGTLGDGENQ